MHRKLHQASSFNFNRLNYTIKVTLFVEYRVERYPTASWLVKSDYLRDCILVDCTIGQNLALHSDLAAANTVKGHLRLCEVPNCSFSSQLDNDAAVEDIVIIVLAPVDQ